MFSFGLRVTSAREWTEAGIWLVTARLLGRDPSWVGDQGRSGGHHADAKDGSGWLASG
jgi:hypothetical protein